MLNVFQDIETKRIKSIEVIGTLQMWVFVFARFQISEMVISPFNETFSRAHIKVLIDKINNGINARSRGEYTFQY